MEQIKLEVASDLSTYDETGLITPEENSSTDENYTQKTKYPSCEPKEICGLNNDNKNKDSNNTINMQIIYEGIEQQFIEQRIKWNGSDPMRRNKLQ